MKLIPHPLAIALITIVVSLKCQAAVSYSDFSSTAGLNLTGAATQSGNTVLLTPATGDLNGGLWYAQKQYVAGGFDTSFSFRITNPGGIAGGGDGISFSIQNQSATAVGSEYGPASAPALGVSFNTFQNPGEPSANFVGIATDNGPAGGTWVSLFDLNSTSINLKDGSVHNATIDYHGTGLSVILDGVSVFNNVNVPLGSAVDGSGLGWAGFGARTGGAFENQSVLSWTMVVPEPGGAGLALFGIGSLFVYRRRWNCPQQRRG
jgi:hypothetical protein